MSDIDDLLKMFGPSPRNWPGPAGVIGRALGVEAQVKSHDAKDIFLLDRHDRAVLVLGGKLDLFTLADGPTPESQGIHGIRHHLVRVPAGGVAFGLAGGEAVVAASPSCGTELVTVDRAAVLALSHGQEAEAAAVAEAVDRWLADIASRPGCHSPPRDAVVLSEGRSQTLAAGAVGLAAMHPVMAELHPAELELGDSDREAIGDRTSFVDVVADQWWIRARRELDHELELTPMTVAEWLARPDCAADLDIFHRRVVAATARRIAEDQERWGRRAASRRLHVQGVFGRALRGLVGIVPGNGGALASVPDHPLAAAFALVCDDMKLRFTLPRGYERTLDKCKDKVDGLAKATGLQVREVRLAPGWWRRDHGPLLVFAGAERRPAAARMIRPGRYVLTEPLAGQAQAVTAAVAKDIDLAAYAIGPSLPSGAVTPGRAFRFAATGRSREGWHIAMTIVFNSLLGLVPPVVTGWIMDPVIPQGQTGQLAVLVMALVIAGLAGTGFSLIQSIAMIRMEGGMEQRLQAAIWDRLLKLPVSFFRDFSVGDLANRAQGIDSMRQMISGAVSSSLMTGVSGLFSLGLMVYYSWRLALVTAIVGLVYTGIVYVLGRKVLSRNREIMRTTGMIQGVVLQLLGGVARLRVGGAERSAFAIWAERYAGLLTVQFHQAMLSNWVSVFKAVFNFLAFIAVLGMIGVSAHVLFATFHQATGWPDLAGAALKKAMPVGEFVSFNAAYGQFMAAVFGITQVAVQLLNLRPLYERIHPILSAEEENADTGQEDPGDVEGELEVREVHFRYRPDLPTVLNGLTLRAEAGQFVALVGPSGAGKSSLLRLLLGFDVPERGSVFLDGRDLRTLDKRALRRNYGVVLQSGRVLAGNIFHNITAGANLTREDAWEAARLAGFDRDIEQMPMGMDTFLSEGATTISGGQRQRLMIARAVVRRPRVLIFDEATSALDNETQAIVSRGLETLKCTRVVIAHRLSTIIGADMIFVIDRGQVTESGRHDELMAKGGAYTELARRQIA